MSEMEILVAILIKRLTKEQLHEVLEDVSVRIIDGFCPLCYAEEIAVDAEGNEIEDDDVSDAYEWREQHSDECPVTLIEASPKYQSGEVKP